MTQAEISERDSALMEQSLRLTRGFVSWPPGPMALLLTRSRLRRHSRGDVLSTGTDAPEAIAVVSGHVVVGRTPPGGMRTTVAFLGPGLVLGFARIPDIGDLSVYDFSANDNVVAVHMPLQLVLDILEKSPKLWKDMAAMLMRQHRDQFDALVDHMAGPLQRRLAGTIDRLATLYGTRASREGSLRLRLTQESLSLLLQVTRQSVNKELKALAALGTIELEYNTIAVLDPAALKRFAQ